MFLRKMLAIAMVLLTLCMSVGFATSADTVESLTASILDNIAHNFFAAPVTQMWKDHYTKGGVYTEAQWEQAVVAAIAQAKEQGIWYDEWEDDPTVLRSDLGDKSLPLYALCGLAVAAASGVVLARKKCLSAC